MSGLLSNEFASLVYPYPVQVEKTSQSTNVLQHRLDILRIEKEAVVHATKHQLLENFTQQLGEEEQLR